MDDLLEAAGGHRFASDAVDLVEGVRLEDALVGGADEDLQAERLLASVAVELRRQEKKANLSSAAGFWKRLRVLND